MPTPTGVVVVDHSSVGGTRKLAAARFQGKRVAEVATRLVVHRA